MIYSLLISIFFFICWMTIIQIISEYPFSLKEVGFVFLSVGIPLLLYQILFTYGISRVIYLIPGVLLVLAVVYKKSYHLLSLTAISAIGALYNPIFSKVVGEEYIKQSPNILGKNDGGYDPILIGMIGGLVFFLLENLIYALYGTGSHTIISRSIITALVHLVTGGLIGYSFIHSKYRRIVVLMIGVLIHIGFNIYNSDFSYLQLVLMSLLSFILIGYLLQLSSRLYLVKIT